MIDVQSLCKGFVQQRWYSRKKFHVTAVDNVSLSIERNSTLALVGESGSGKTTFGLCLALLEKPDSGEIWFDGTNVLALGTQELFAFRRNVQFIFQDSATAMNPRFSAAEVIEEPLRIQFQMSRKTRREQALAMMEQVGIPPEWAERSPLQFSGGQRQRLAIARALVLKPSFLILDEALSNLDLPIQAQVSNLLLDLQASLSLTYLFITHDLLLAANLANRIAVMWHGKIIESGSSSTVFCDPQHAYTRSLLGATPEFKMPEPGLRNRG